MRWSLLWNGVHYGPEGRGTLSDLTDRRTDSSASPLWQLINQTTFTAAEAEHFANFKSSQMNFKLALWNPATSGVRYLKTLIYNLCAALGSEQWAKLRKIRHREIGQPIVVRYNHEDVCQDYLQAIFELEFLTKHVELDAAVIVEIGAGYGRTCHAVVSNCAVARYTIVDLPPCLALSKRYLGEVLDPPQLARIEFVTVDEFAAARDLERDLYINIDSFTEMDARVVRDYLDAIRKDARHMYVKNPVGKYRGSSFGVTVQDESVAELALSTGLLGDTVDVKDRSCGERQSQKCVQVYRPDEDWVCVDASWAPPWTYYWQAVFGKAETGR